MKLGDTVNFKDYAETRKLLEEKLTLMDAEEKIKKEKEEEDDAMAMKERNKVQIDYKNYISDNSNIKGNKKGKNIEVDINSD